MFGGLGGVGSHLSSGAAAAGGTPSIAYTWTGRLSDTSSPSLPPLDHAPQLHELHWPLSGHGFMANVGKDGREAEVRCRCEVPVHRSRKQTFSRPWHFQLQRRSPKSPIWPFFAMQKRRLRGTQRMPRIFDSGNGFVCRAPETMTITGLEITLKRICELRPRALRTS